MKKLLLLTVAVLGMGAAQAQHIPGTKTLSVVPVSNSDYTLFVMGTKDYVKESYVSSIHMLDAGGITIEPGRFYAIAIRDNQVFKVIPFPYKEEK